MDPHAFAAPGWRCTAASLGAVDDAGFTYRSDTRGTAPYRPAVGGHAFRAPELPTTLPTLDETYGAISRDSAVLADDLVARLRPGALEVLTMHAEIEGGPHADVLDAFLARTVGRVRFVRLCDEAAALDAAALPICEVRDGMLPGRPLPVAVQQSPRAHGSSR